VTISSPIDDNDEEEGCEASSTQDSSFRRCGEAGSGSDRDAASGLQVPLRCHCCGTLLPPRGLWDLFETMAGVKEDTRPMLTALGCLLVPELSVLYS